MSTTPNKNKGMMRGKVRCGYCAEPLRDHEGFGPCPWWEVGLVKSNAFLEEQKHGRVVNGGRKRRWT